MDEIDGLTMDDLSVNRIIRRGEQWTVGTVGKLSSYNNFNGLELTCGVGTTTTASVINPTENPILGAGEDIEIVDLLSGFADDSIIPLHSQISL